MGAVKTVENLIRHSRMIQQINRLRQIGLHIFEIAQFAIGVGTVLEHNRHHHFTAFFVLFEGNGTGHIIHLAAVIPQPIADTAPGIETKRQFVAGMFLRQQPLKYFDCLGKRLCRGGIIIQRVVYFAQCLETGPVLINIIHLLRTLPLLK